MKNLFCYIVFCLLIISACHESDQVIAKGNHENYAVKVASEDRSIVPGAAQMAMYYPMIKGRRLGLVVNQTSRVGNVHLVDSLLDLDANITAIFPPEHGFRGKADAGETIDSGKDAKTGVSIRSIYGKSKKPSPEMLSDIDVMIFDLQDVGARFYTYISTLHYVMEACAEQNIPVIVLDRPNPNGFFVDGPVLKSEYKSFVGMHEIPVVHGMTTGEYAKMINGEGWLSNGIKCDLDVIPCVNYLHNMTYDLPINPSPNLPNLRSILLYPSICFFEGTKVSIGRGTNKQFQIIGHPSLSEYDYSFTPVSSYGAKYPKLENENCKGIDLTKLSVDYIKGNAKIDLSYLIEVYNSYPNKEEFFLENLFFDKLAGSDLLRKQLIAGLNEDEIRASWQPELEEFKVTRSKYLIYPEG